MGHTHTPISDLSGSMVHYVNSGFECPATPDMPSQSVSFTIIDATACTATVQRATLAGNTIGSSHAQPPPHRSSSSDCPTSPAT